MIIITGGSPDISAHSGLNGIKREYKISRPRRRCMADSSAGVRPPVDLRRLAAEHGRPELHELGLVEAAVMVAVEHLHQSESSRSVDAHHLTDDRHHLVLAQNAVSVFVQLVETLRQFVITSTHMHTHT